MMISGEYAVLEGAEAIVAAVDRRAIARLGGGSSAIPAPAPEVQAAFREAQARIGRVEGEVTLDASSMRDGGLKIGLGSSAAGAAAAAGLVYAAHGRNPEDPQARTEILNAALAGHRAVSPKGSGADVAASVRGGFLRFRRLGDTVESYVLDWPSALEIRVVWTGQEARTSNFLAKVEGLATSSPGRYRSVLAALGSEADAFVSAALAKDVPGIIESTAAYGEAMRELGVAAGIEIVTDTLSEVADLARKAGGAAKPSGAGGGDVALCLFPDSASAERFERFCSASGLRILSIKLGVPGVKLEPSDGTTTESPSAFGGSEAA
jgi:phosphomevalonate kinase